MCDVPIRWEVTCATATQGISYLHRAALVRCQQIARPVSKLILYLFTVFILFQLHFKHKDIEHIMDDFLRFSCVFFPDIDECQQSDRACSVNSDCQNNEGSYICNCKPGYTNVEGSETKCVGLYCSFAFTLYFTEIYVVMNL